MPTSPASTGPALAQGGPLSLADLAPDTLAALAKVQAAAGARDKDWARYTRQAAEFHLKNARAWANAATGTDLASQVDPGFILGPHAFAAPELIARYRCSVEILLATALVSACTSASIHDW